MGMLHSSGRTVIRSKNHLLLTTDHATNFDCNIRYEMRSSIEDAAPKATGIWLMSHRMDVFAMIRPGFG